MLVRGLQVVKHRSAEALRLWRPVDPWKLGRKWFPVSTAASARQTSPCCFSRPPLAGGSHSSAFGYLSLSPGQTSTSYDAMPPKRFISVQKFFLQRGQVTTPRAKARGFSSNGRYVPFR
jgi:hypothetical protein